MSYDGREWRQTGNVLHMPDPMPDARVAVFADRSHSNAPTVEALFDRLSVGHEFHSYADGPANLAPFAPWKYSTTCDGAPPAVFDHGALELPLGTLDQTCQSSLSRPIPDGDWTVVSLLDFLSANGTAAGLRVHGAGGQFRVIRWDLNGGSLTAEHLGFNQASIPDFPGSPPVIVRMDCHSGIVTTSVSRNDRNLITLPLAVRLSDIGANPEYEITSVKSTWGGAAKLQPARFLYVRQYVQGTCATSGNPGAFQSGRRTPVPQRHLRRRLRARRQQQAA